MYKVLVVDDEKPAREELRFLLDKFKHFEVVGEAATGAETIKKVTELNPDLVLLDIKMPDMDGFSVARELINLSNTPKIIFVTAYDEYAVKAFEINAVDYLLKPVTEKRLSSSLARFMQFSSDDQVKKIINLLQSETKSDNLHRIPANKDGKIIIIPVQDVSFIETEGKNTIIHTEDNSYTSSYNLTELEQRLEGLPFFRIHRSYIVNLAKIKEIIPWFHNTYQVKMQGYDEPIPVSRKHINKLKELLNL